MCSGLRWNGKEEDNGWGEEANKTTPVGCPSLEGRRHGNSAGGRALAIMCCTASSISSSLEGASARVQSCWCKSSSRVKSKPQAEDSCPIEHRTAAFQTVTPLLGFAKPSPNVIPNDWRRFKRLHPFWDLLNPHLTSNDWRRFKRLHPFWDLLNPHLTSFLMIGGVSNGYTPPGIC